MDLSNLLLIIKNYSQIMVSGPQRSGTTIAAKIIAMELGYPFFPEEAFNAHEVYSCLISLYNTIPKFVVQAPGMSPYIRLFPGAVIFMKRPVHEIINSQRRVSWPNHEEEREKTKYFLSDDPNHICEIKYRIWYKYQKDLPDKFELEYHSLESHKLWVEDRKNFHIRQTEN